MKTNKQSEYKLINTSGIRLCKVYNIKMYNMTLSEFGTKTLRRLDYVVHIGVSARLHALPFVCVVTG